MAVKSLPCEVRGRDRLEIPQCRPNLRMRQPDPGAPTLPSPARGRAVRGTVGGCKAIVPLNWTSLSSGLQEPLSALQGEREGPAKREGEVGGAANGLVGPPHPALSPRSAGREGK